jgi:hypothetical protein
MIEAVLLSMRMEGSPTPLIFHVKMKQEIQSEKSHAPASKRPLLGEFPAANEEPTLI